jgi:nitrate/nitrite transporter NarK
VILRRPSRTVKAALCAKGGHARGSKGKLIARRNLIFGASIKATGGPHLALEIFLAFYVTCVTITWWYYMRKSFLARRVPSLAEGGV